MAVERRRYPEAFKREAVRLMETSGKPISQIAGDLGVNDNNLYRWRGRMAVSNSGVPMAIHPVWPSWKRR